MARARAARQDVLVTFTARRGCFTAAGRYSKEKACRAPSASAYRKAFRAFDATFPWVKTYSAWNEINHQSQPTYKSPRTAAGYYNVLQERPAGASSASWRPMCSTRRTCAATSSVPALRQGLAAAVGSAQLRRRQPPPDKLHQGDAAHRPRRGVADRDRRHRQAAAELQALALARRRAGEGHVPAGGHLRHASARHALENHAAVCLRVVRRARECALRRRTGQRRRLAAQSVLSLRARTRARTAREICKRRADPWRCSRRLRGGSGRGVGVLRGGRERLGAVLRRRRVHPRDLPAVAVEVEEAA